MILKSVIVWSSDLDKIKKIEKGVSLNNLTFLDYNKTIIKIDNKKTDFFLINFWASWCAPCIKEMKDFSALKRRLPKIRILTISQDSDISDALAFFKKNKYENLEQYYDFDKEISKRFSLRGLPTTLIYNKDYEVIAKVEGIIKWDSDQFIAWLLNN
tara:strand:- start:96 stop:566 length:471 start_codon:yes stop_codon:yes gene_type:complete